MALKKIERKEQKDWTSFPLLRLGKSSFVPEDKAIFGDLLFDFEISNNSITKDIERLRNQAVNGIVQSREDEELNCIYELTSFKGENKIFEIVYGVESATDDFLAAVKETYGDGVKLSSVPVGQLPLSVPIQDESMIQYNKERNTKEQAVYRFVESLSALESGEKHTINPIRVFGREYVFALWHTGLDGETYFNFAESDGQESVGMSEERLVQFLTNASLVDVENLSASFQQSKFFNPDIEELLYLENTVGGAVLDRELVYHSTKDYNEAQMASLKTNLQTRLEEFYNGLHCDYLITDAQFKEEISSIDKFIDSWLGPWPLLSGKMDSQLKLNESDHKITSKDLANITGKAVHEHPEFRKNIIGWFKNRCEEYDLNVKSLPASLKLRLKTL